MNRDWADWLVIWVQLGAVVIAALAAVAAWLAALASRKAVNESNVALQREDLRRMHRLLSELQYADHTSPYNPDRGAHWFHEEFKHLVGVAGLDLPTCREIAQSETSDTRQLIVKAQQEIADKLTSLPTR
jgi:hypothetical protein